jgi:hypothetical protein
MVTGKGGKYACNKPEPSGQLLSNARGGASKDILCRHHAEKHGNG